MKKFVILLFLLLAAAAHLSARSYVVGEHRTSPRASRRSMLAGNAWHNLGFTHQKIDLAGTNTLKFAPRLKGVSISSGHSFMVHERPLWRVVHLGFDVAWVDAEVGRWSRQVDGARKWMQKFDLGIGAGPGVHISPGGRFGVHLYMRYMPTYSIVMHNFAGEEDGNLEIVQGLAQYIAGGLAVSWDAFSVGAEYRRGGGRYSGVKVPDITVDAGGLELVEDLMNLRAKDALDKQKHTMRGLRLYISFRF